MRLWVSILGRGPGIDMFENVIGGFIENITVENFGILYFTKLLILGPQIKHSSLEMPLCYH